MSDDSGPFSGVDLPDGPTEESTERDGVLSYAGEWHALFVGFLVGLSGSLVFMGAFIAFVFGMSTGKFRETAHLQDAAQEPAYSGFGVAAGYFVNLVFIGASLLAEAGISPL